MFQRILIYSSYTQRNKAKHNAEYFYDGRSLSSRGHPVSTSPNAALGEHGWEEACLGSHLQPEPQRASCSPLAAQLHHHPVQQRLSSLPRTWEMRVGARGGGAVGDGMDVPSWTSCSERSRGQIQGGDFTLVIRGWDMGLPQTIYSFLLRTGVEEILK